MVIDANTLEYDLLTRQIRASNDPVINIDNCLGQRYIGSGPLRLSFAHQGCPRKRLGRLFERC